MNSKTRNIIGWILTAILALLFFASAAAKLLDHGDTVKNAANFGLSPKKFMFIGIVEIISAILFIIPRTGLLGTLLLAAYLGGAIATHLEHFMSPMGPVIFQCILWITAVIRFPELSRRLMGSSEPI